MLKIVYEELVRHLCHWLTGGSALRICALAHYSWYAMVSDLCTRNAEQCCNTKVLVKEKVTLA
jgi:hypothetical protein